MAFFRTEKCLQFIYFCPQGAGQAPQSILAQHGTKRRSRRRCLIPSAEHCPGQERKGGWGGGASAWPAVPGWQRGEQGGAPGTVCENMDCLLGFIDSRVRPAPSSTHRPPLTRHLPEDLPSWTPATPPPLGPAWTPEPPAVSRAEGRETAASRVEGSRCGGRGRGRAQPAARGTCVTPQEKLRRPAPLHTQVPDNIHIHIHHVFPIHSRTGGHSLAAQWSRTHQPMQETRV